MAEVPLFVLDASVGSKWFLSDEKHVAQATQVKDDFEDGRCRLVAPSLIRVEVASALSKAPRRMDRPGRPSYPQAWQSVLDFDTLDLELVPTENLMAAGFRTAARYECSYYDALYIALAEHLNCPFIYADDTLRRTLRGRVPSALWIEDYRS